MDKNTITGIILIFVIFIGFSIYNSGRMNKAYEKSVVIADSLYNKGDLEKARAEYMNAMRFKPNQPDVILKLNDIDLRLGLSSSGAKADSAAKAAITTVQEVKDQDSLPREDDPGQLGVFGGSAKGKNEFITLENNKLELKISSKGGRVYSARLKDYRTYDSLPLILFDGDSTIFGLNFFTSDNKPVKTNDLYFSPVSDERSYDATRQVQNVVLRLNADSGKYIEYIYSLAPDKYVVEFKINFVSLDGIIAANQSSLTLDWRMYIARKEMPRPNEDNYTTIKYKY